MWRKPFKALSNLIQETVNSLMGKDNAPKPLPEVKCKGPRIVGTPTKKSKKIAKTKETEEAEELELTAEEPKAEVLEEELPEVAEVKDIDELEAEGDLEFGEEDDDLYSKSRKRRRRRELTRFKGKAPIFTPPSSTLSKKPREAQPSLTKVLSSCGIDIKVEERRPLEPVKSLKPEPALPASLMGLTESKTVVARQTVVELVNDTEIGMFAKTTIKEETKTVNMATDASGAKRLDKAQVIEKKVPLPAQIKEHPPKTQKEHEMQVPKPQKAYEMHAPQPQMHPIMPPKIPIHMMPHNHAQEMHHQLPQLQREME